METGGQRKEATESQDPVVSRDLDSFSFSVNEPLNLTKTTLALSQSDIPFYQIIIPAVFSSLRH